jgi:acyl-CoA thioesterase II
MHSTLQLIDLLSLEKIEENIFRGQNYQSPWGRVFGGQVLAQSLHAAYQTVEAGRFVHSLHSYFLLTGDLSLPIVFNVERIRDGGSFSTRRVVAVQKGRPIFILSASFQIPHDGLDHQIEMPNVPSPHQLLTDEELAESLRHTMPHLHKRVTLPRPMECRPVEQFDLVNPQNDLPFQHIWIKAKGDFEVPLSMQQQILSYISDFNLLLTAMLPHRNTTASEQIFFASLDHAMWFHRPFKTNEWLLFAMDSPSAFNERGFTRGNFFTEDGKLVASVVQEGLMRRKP